MWKLKDIIPPDSLAKGYGSNAGTGVVVKPSNA